MEELERYLARIRGKEKVTPWLASSNEGKVRIACGAGRTSNRSIMMVNLEKTLDILRICGESLIQYTTAPSLSRTIWHGHVGKAPCKTNWWDLNTFERSGSARDVEPSILYLSIPAFPCRRRRGRKGIGVGRWLKGFVIWRLPDVLGRLFGSESCTGCTVSRFGEYPEMCSTDNRWSYQTLCVDRNIL